MTTPSSLSLETEPTWIQKMRDDAACQAATLPTQEGEPFSALVSGAEVSWERHSLALENSLETSSLSQRNGGGVGSAAEQDSVDVLRALQMSLAKQGVVFCSLAEAVRKDHPVVRAHLGRLVEGNETRVAALNAAYWSQGTFLYVPAGISVSMPLQPFFRTATPAAARFSRNLIVLDPGAQAEFLEGCVMPQADLGMDVSWVSELFLGENARLHCLSFWNWGKGARVSWLGKARLAGGAHLNWVQGSWGGTSTTWESELCLPAHGARGIVRFATLVPGGSQTLVTTKVSEEGTEEGTPSPRAGQDRERIDVSVTAQAVVAGAGARARLKTLVCVEAPGEVMVGASPREETSFSGEGASCPGTRVQQSALSLNQSTSCVLEEERWAGNRILTRAERRVEGQERGTDGSVEAFLHDFFAALPMEYALEAQLQSAPSPLFSDP